MLFHIVEKKKRSRPMSPKAQLEQEKRMRREIANSNERRRMQCINAGFQSLRALMPQLSGEKLSKAAILQHTTEYIAKLEQEQKRYQSQNEQLKRMLMEYGRAQDLEQPSESPPPKRKKRDTECSDEGIGMLEPAAESGKEPQQSLDELQREVAELRQQLERERSLRHHAEDRNRSMEAQCLVTVAPCPSPRGHMSPPVPQSHSPINLHQSHSPVNQHQSHSPINLKVESPVHRSAAVPEPSAVHHGQHPHDECTLASPDPAQPYHQPSPAPAQRPPHRPHHHQQQQQHSHHHHHQQQQQQQPAQHMQPVLPLRHNLENLVEAIRQIEGDRALCDDSHFCFGEERDRGEPRLTAHSRAHHSHGGGVQHVHSEDSERESSVSEVEDCRSEGSGRDSPSPLGLCARRLQISASAAVVTTQAPVGALSDKYPIASTLLHRPYHGHAFFRPPVIVHKS